MPLKRAHLVTPGTTNFEEKVVRAASAALATYGCNDTTGRWQGDPVFEHIVEGRQTWWLVNGKRRDYSGCGDLIHWTFWNLIGAEQDSDARWLNRAEAFGYRVGVNVSNLRWKCPAWRSFKKGQFNPSRGDCLLIGEHGGEHVAIVDSVGDGTYTSMDYGQFSKKFGKHGGVKVTRPFRKGRDGRVWVGTVRIKPVIGVVDVWEMYKLVDPEWPALVPQAFAMGQESDNPYSPAPATP